MKKITSVLLDPLVVVVLILFATIIATWIPHNNYTYFNTEELNNPNLESLISESGKYGLMDSLYAIWFGYQQMFPTFLYILSAGILFTILFDNDAFKVLLGDVIKGSGHNKYIFGNFIFIFIFLLSSLIGFFEHFIIIAPFLIISFRQVNIDKKVAAITIILSACLGRCFSTLSPYTYQVGYDAIDNLLNGEKINHMIGMRFAIAGVGLCTSLILYNTLLYVFKNDELEFEEEEVVENKHSRLIIYFAWAVFLGMLVALILGSIDWAHYFGDDFHSFNDWWTTNLWFISSVFKPIGEWGMTEKVMVITIAIAIISLVFHLSKNEYIFGTQMLSQAIVNILKIYAVFAISKSISLIMIYSGLADTITSMITWKANAALFILAMLPILIIVSLLINSQTSTFLLFTPIVAGIIEGASFANPDLVFNIFLATLSLVTGALGLITPTQAMNTITVERNEINRAEYMKVMVPITIGLIALFAFIAFPIILLI